MPLDTLKARRKRLWREYLFDTRGTEAESKQEQRLALMEIWSRNNWAYLTGRDLPDPERDPDWVASGGRPIYWTVDERDDANPIKPFPYIVEPENFLYLKHTLTEMWGPWRIVLLDKARQVYATTLACGAIDWYGSFHDEREIFVSRVKEESAIKMINDRIRTPHSRKPRWLQDLIEMSQVPMNVITYGRTGSTVTGVAQNFAEADARGPTASLIMVDEAAYQSYFPQIYQAVLPMTSRLWAITTANIGNPGAALFRDLIMEGRPKREYGEEVPEVPQGDVALLDRAVEDDRPHDLHREG